MKKFYKINTDNTASIGSGTQIPQGFTEYTKGSEPLELITALDAQTQKENIKKINDDIYKQLELIDKKSIRAFRENDAVRLAALESEAKILRLKLVSPGQI